MKILKILLLLSFSVTSLSTFSMHHETSHNFSDCEGEVGNLYISKMLKNATKNISNATKYCQTLTNTKNTSRNWKTR